MQLRTASAFVCLVVTLGLLVGCGSGHSATAGTSGASTTGTTTSNTTAAETPTVTGVTVSSSSISIAAGQTAQLSATASYSDSSTQPLSSATWTTSNSNVATVSSSGLVTAVGVGTATITVSSGSISQTVSILVTPAALVQINLTPASGSIAISQTIQFTASGIFSDGSTQEITKQASWSSSDANISFLSPGFAFGQAATKSAATITASLSGINGTASLSVSSATLASIDVAPDTAAIPIGANQQFVATGTWTDNSTQDVTTNPVVSWNSDTPAVASVGASTGLALALTTGTANISANAGAISDSSQLLVGTGYLTGITVTPANPAIPTFLNQQFTATGTFSDGSFLDITATVAWNSSNTSVATINAAGLAIPVASGSTNITASYGGITSAANTLAVTGGHLVAIVVTTVHSGATVGAGATVQYSATGQFDDGSVSDVSNFATWNSSNANVATISATGVASTGAIGQSTISATLAGVTGSTVLTVSKATLAEIIILPSATNPSTLSLDVNGLPIQPSLSMTYRAFMTVTAWGYYTDQSFHVLTGAHFSSSNPSIASTIFGFGWVFSNHKSGTVTIKATWNDSTSHASYSGSAALTVSNATISSVAVTPNPGAVAAGTGLQFAATAHLSDGTTQDITSSVRWTTSNYRVATVTFGGFANGIAPGTVTVTATYYQSGTTVSGGASLTVTSATLSSIAVGPTPANIPLGTSLQLSATGTFSDASQQDLSTQVSWASQNIGVVVMSHSTPGLAVSSGAGSTTVTASKTGVIGTTSVVVTGP